MRAWGAVFAMALALVSPMVHAATVHAGQIPLRHKPGPVTLRGVASGVHAGEFTLKTKTAGSFTVTVLRQTTVFRRKAPGRASLTEGDHVYVRGLVSGRHMTAIRIEIVPVKAKAFSVRGVIASSDATHIIVLAAGKPSTIRLTPQTVLEGRSVAHVVAGDHVQVRVQKVGSTLLALRIHVYAKKVTGRHVQLHGTVTAVQKGTIVIVAGSNHYEVRLTPQTAIHVGTQLVASTALRPGASVTVYACCDGGSLTATSVHVHASRVAVHAVNAKGVVVRITGVTLMIRTAQGSLAVSSDRSTVVSVGAVHSGLAGIRVGDSVSLRLTRSGSGWKALRIRVLAISRRPRTVIGTVVASSAGVLTVRSRSGKPYIIVVDSHTTITAGTRRLSMNSVRTGDRVRASGLLQGSRLNAARIAITPAKVIVKSVRGTVQRVSGSGEIVVAGDDGVTYRIHPAPGVRVQHGGVSAPSTALFPGVKMRARGRLSGSVMTASSVTVSVTSKSIKGRIDRVSAGALGVRVTRTGEWTIDLNASALLSDGGKRISVGGIHVGAYASVQGYVERPGTLRATRVNIYHPILTLTGTVTSTSGGKQVQTSRGEKYLLRFTSSTHISSGRVQINITAADITTGMRVRVSGTVGSDGALQVAEITAHLASVSSRGQVSQVNSGEVAVRTGSDTLHVQLTSSTVIEQGSTAVLKAADLVVGDDVTVYGYRVRAGKVLARKLLVHRSRISVLGAVTSVTTDGFVMDAPDGSHRVIVGSATLVTDAGQHLAAGMDVRVSGYLRGDGVILATRVTVKAKRGP